MKMGGYPCYFGAMPSGRVQERISVPILRRRGFRATRNLERVQLLQAFLFLGLAGGNVVVAGDLIGERRIRAG